MSQSKTPVTFLYSALDNYGGHPFADQFDIVHPAYGPPDFLSPKGALILWGGADISPSIYGQKPSKHTSAGKELSERDKLELALASAAIRQQIPIIGICRGAQLLCALAGGKLVQHVSGHGNDHTIRTSEGQQVITSSLHHQMMFPWGMKREKFKILAWADPLKSEEYIGENDVDVDFGDNLIDVVASELPVHHASEIIEPEVIYFPEIKGLGIQGHPEFIANIRHPFVQYTKELVDEYIKPHLIE